MPVTLTAAQARALGITADPDWDARVVGPPPRRRTRRALPRDRAPSTCHTCGAVFDTDAAETRHVADTGHARYDLDATTVSSS